MTRSDDRPDADPDELADVLAEVARTLLEEDDFDRVLDRISSLAVETIGPAEHCGITVVDGRRVWTAAKTDDVPEVVDRLQYETGEGPCLSAIHEHEVFQSGDITAEHDRWPAFSARAGQETDVRSVLSFRLFTGDRTYGAMNMYASERNAFSEHDHHVGSAFAAHAAVAMSGAGLVDSLRRALDTRDVIATAKGIIMSANGVGPDEAFEVLRRTSQHRNEKLVDVARSIVDRRTPPPAV